MPITIRDVLRDVAGTSLTAQASGQGCIATLGGVAVTGSAVHARLSIATDGLTQLDTLLYIDGGPNHPDAADPIHIEAELDGSRRPVEVSGGGGIDDNGLGSFLFNLRMPISWEHDPPQGLALIVSWERLDGGRMKLELDCGLLRRIINSAS